MTAFPDGKKEDARWGHRTGVPPLVVGGLGSLAHRNLDQTRQLSYAYNRAARAADAQASWSDAAKHKKHLSSLFPQPLRRDWGLPKAHLGAGRGIQNPTAITWPACRQDVRRLFPFDMINEWVEGRTASFRHCCPLAQTTLENRIYLVPVASAVSRCRREGSVPLAIETVL